MVERSGEPSSGNSETTFAVEGTLAQRAFRSPCTEPVSRSSTRCAVANSARRRPPSMAHPKYTVPNTAAVSWYAQHEVNCRGSRGDVDRRNTPDEGRDTREGEKRPGQRDHDHRSIKRVGELQQTRRL
eukprot:9481259-Pyramimonas_sp.AAC.3